MNVEHILKNKNAGNYIAEANDSLADAIKTMAANRIGSLIVLKNGQPDGIVTERDVMYAAAEHSNKMFALKVAEVMSSHLITCNLESTLDHAMEMMINNETEHRIRHLPVVDNEGQFAGIISMSDVVSALLTKTEFENKLLMNYIKNWPDAEA
ncbi:hypothetical protein MNBD_GAMMA16-362 [hydrothermal vent metagenome]|uniref:CBS domain-containing protein n=1 Tax=hydrothermal vent metagenome TaxID=652676 RepID=A0A3B0ZE26_9ZZZZ